MALLTALLVIGIACAIAAWFVIREAGRMAAEPPPPVFDPEEAYEWVVEHVPDDVAAAADARLVIPVQPGLRSLNVAMAAAMALGEALRQTRRDVSERIL